MANGDDKNWIRLCGTIDGFQARFGRWPTRIRIMPVSYIDLVSHVLSPLGFALVSTVVELVPEDDAEFIAEDDTGDEYCYGVEGFPDPQPELNAHQWFGEAIFRTAQ